MVLTQLVHLLTSLAIGWPEERGRIGAAYCAHVYLTLLQSDQSMFSPWIQWTMCSYPPFGECVYDAEVVRLLKAGLVALDDKSDNHFCGLSHSVSICGLSQPNGVGVLILKQQTSFPAMV